MIVYRLEHKETGSGPYSAPGCLGCLVDHLCPQESDPVKSKEITQEHLFSWSAASEMVTFMKNPGRIENRGYVVHVLEVDDDTLQFPDGQVCFKNRLQTIGIHDPMDFIKLFSDGEFN